MYPHELDCDVVEEVIESLGLSERCVLTSVLEEASAVLAVKARVKGATWLSTPRARRACPSTRSRRRASRSWRVAIQAMLGLNARIAADASDSGSGFGAGMGGSANDTDTDNTANGEKTIGEDEGAARTRTRRDTRLERAASFPPENSSLPFLVAIPSRPARRAECLSERGGDGRAGGGAHGGGTAGDPAPGAGGAAPRGARLLAMQKALIEREYRLEVEECGEGDAKRIRILHTYVK